MKKAIIRIPAWIVCLGLMLVCLQFAAAQQKKDDVLFQYSTLDALMMGVYDGAMTYGELKRYGDFGIGTFNTLDGEMVEVDHQVYQVKADGLAYPAADTLKSPFAVVTIFTPDRTIHIDSSFDCEQLKSYLDKQLSTINVPYAVKIKGVFAQLQTRSVPKQSPPYKILTEVLKTQPTFDFQNVEGVLVGFRLPSYMAGANAAGYHFHFLTADRKAGGHVLKCQVRRATVEIDETHEWNVALPKDEAFYKANLSKDTPDELKPATKNP
jgi:acetolactate decarboxylase